jgi:hypothetical protein
MMDELDACWETNVVTAEEVAEATDALVKLATEINRRSKEAEWKEVQIVYANAAARLELAAPNIDHEARKDCEQAGRRLFALFSVDCAQAKWLLPAYWAYKQRLLYHSRRES